MIELKLKEVRKKQDMGKFCGECPNNKEIVDYYFEVSGDPTAINDFKDKLSRVKPKRRRSYLERRVKFLY